MKTPWIRHARNTLASLCAATLLLACGGESVVTDLTPQRFITVGDGFTDVGQAGHVFSVNDGSALWVQEFAAHYGQSVTPACSGGWGYAQGHARVNSADTLSGTNAPSVAEQITTLLARTTLHASEDVVIINGGLSDIVAAVNAGGISDATTDTVKAAGKALADQVRRVVDAGGKHVLVVGVYNLGNTPWGQRLGKQGDLEKLSVAFNTAVSINIMDLWKNVLFVDPALLHNLIYNKPENYLTDNARDPVCTTPDASTCTTSTLVAGADYNRWMFADQLYFTPRTSRRFGSSDYSESIYWRFKERW